MTSPEYPVGEREAHAYRAPHLLRDNPHTPTSLTRAQYNALRLAQRHQLVLIWEGPWCKPWYALTGGVLPTTLHALWLGGLLRAERHAGAIATEIGPEGARLAVSADRALITTTGRRLVAEYEDNTPVFTWTVETAR